MAKEIQKGFYYHYKHDPNGQWNNYLYEVVGVGHHTEIDGLDESAMVVYRPLYEATVYTNGKHLYIRPFDMFMETIQKDSVSISRFSHITDETLIKRCEELRDRMYNI